MTQAVRIDSNVNDTTLTSALFFFLIYTKHKSINRASDLDIHWFGSA